MDCKLLFINPWPHVITCVVTGLYITLDEIENKEQWKHKAPKTWIRLENCTQKISATCFANKRRQKTKQTWSVTTSPTTTQIMHKLQTHFGTVCGKGSLSADWNNLLHWFYRVCNKCLQQVSKTNSDLKWLQVLYITQPWYLSFYSWKQ